MGSPTMGSNKAAGDCPGHYLAPSPLVPAPFPRVKEENVGGTARVWDPGFPSRPRPVIMEIRAKTVTPIPLNRAH